MKMPKPATEAVALLDRLVALEPRLKVRKVFGQPSAFLGGNMCFGVFGEELFFRLNDEDLARAAKVPGSHAFEPMAGRAMKGYWILPSVALRTPKDAKEWMARAVAFTEGLPPKK